MLTAAVAPVSQLAQHIHHGGRHGSGCSHDCSGCRHGGQTVRARGGCAAAAVAHAPRGGEQGKLLATAVVVVAEAMPPMRQDVHGVVQLGEAHQDGALQAAAVQMHAVLFQLCGEEQARKAHPVGARARAAVQM